MLTLLKRTVDSTFVITVFRVSDFHHYSERRSFVIAKNFCKSIHELHTAGISLRKIINMCTVKILNLKVTELY